MTPSAFPDVTTTDRACKVDDDLVAALLAEGDSRLAVHQPEGRNKYLCRPRPMPEAVCMSSCTASPVSQEGFDRAGRLHAELMRVAAGERARALEQQGRDIAHRLLLYFAAVGVAEAFLCPSGTDALLSAALLLGLERPGVPMTAILPQASETGTGVKLAATLRPFDGAAPCPAPLLDTEATAMEIPLRGSDGMPINEAAVAAAYHAAAAGVRGRPIVYLTHGTKTGLVAPLEVPDAEDVIVDACQARIEPAAVVAYLRRGWPVVVTGSKFFGGPAFSGAVLFPSARLAALRSMGPANRQIASLGLQPGRGSLGTVLRWTAALEAFEAFAPLAADMAGRIGARAAAIEQGLSRIARVVPVPGQPPRGPGWSDMQTIFTFAVRDPAAPGRLLSAAALRALYTGLANENVLIGQPVELGPFGGLRIAIGARDLLRPAAEADLQRLFATLKAVMDRS